MVKPSSNPRQQTSSSEIAGEPSSSSDKKYRGVRKRKWGKYVSEIRLPNCRERIWLGSYDTAEKAARAFDAALYCLRGSGARFNFPDDPPHIENGRSMNQSEIQVEAARYAQSHGGGEHPTHQVEVADSGSDTMSETSDVLWQHAADYSPSVVSRPEMPLDSGFLDQFCTLGTADNNVADMGLFPEFNEYMGTGDYFVPPLPEPDNNNNNTWQESNNTYYDYDYDYEEQNTGGGSFLWNF